MLDQRNGKKEHYDSYRSIKYVGNASKGESLDETDGKEQGEYLFISSDGLVYLCYVFQEHPYGQRQCMYYFLLKLESNTQVQFSDKEVQATIELSPDELKTFRANPKNKF